ncbi:MAG TPA: hypothetical protein PLF13_04940 [candidate division Zixibacteria bacterium]|nr:hypothetical protein [candidate division Zixibacteria bacterium]
MKKVILLLALMLTVVGCISAPRNTYITVPPEVNLGLQAVQSMLEEYREYAAVMLSYEQSIEHSGSKSLSFGGALFGAQGSSWQYVELIHERYMIIDPEVTYYTYSEFYNKPSAYYARVTSPEGISRLYGLKDFKKEKTPDGEVYRLVFPDVQPGTIVDAVFEYSSRVSKTAPPLQWDIPLEFPIPCNELVVNFSCPDWWELQLKKINDNELPPVEIIRDSEHHMQVINYRATDIEAVTEEAYSPSYRELATYLQMMVVDLSMELTQLNLRMTWAECFEAARKEYLKPSSSDLQAIGVIGDSLAAIYESPVDRLRAVVQYVQEGFAGSWAYHEGVYKKVIAEHSGNSFDLTGLAFFLARHLGLDPQWVVIHSSDDGYCDRSYVNYSQFYTPAMYVQIEDKVYVTFPWIEDMPIEFIPGEYRGQTAIVMSEDIVHFTVMPIRDVSEDLFEEEYDVTIEAGGSVEVKETKTMRGTFAYAFREGINDLQEAEYEDMIRDILTYTGGEVNDLEFELTNVDNDTLPLIFVTGYRLDNVCMVTPEEVIFQTSGLLSPISLSAYRVEEGDRKNPVLVRYEQDHVKKVRLHFPSDWTLSTTFENFDYSNAFGNSQATYVADTGLLTIDQRLVLTPTQQPKESYPELVKLIGEGSELNVPTIVFSRLSGPGADEANQ